MRAMKSGKGKNKTDLHGLAPRMHNMPKINPGRAPSRVGQFEVYRSAEVGEGGCPGQGGRRNCCGRHIYLTSFPAGLLPSLLHFVTFLVSN